MHNFHPKMLKKATFYPSSVEKIFSATLGAGRLLPVIGGRPFCWGVIFKVLIVFEGSFSDIKGTLLGVSFNSCESSI